MKKLFLTLAISAIALIGYSQNLLTFRIDAKVLISTGDSIPSGCVVSFSAHVENVATTGKIAYDMDWYFNTAAKTNKLDRVWACTDRNSRMGSRILSYYQTVSDPTEVSYDSMQAALKAYLESIYGVGNVVII